VQGPQARTTLDCCSRF